MKKLVFSVICIIILPSNLLAMCIASPCYVVELEVESCRDLESRDLKFGVAIVNAKIKAKREVSCASRLGKQSIVNLKAAGPESASVFKFNIKKNDKCKQFDASKKIFAFIEASCCDADYLGCEYHPQFNGSLLEK